MLVNRENFPPAERVYGITIMKMIVGLKVKVLYNAIFARRWGTQKKFANKNSDKEKTNLSNRLMSQRKNKRLMTDSSRCQIQTCNGTKTYGLLIVGVQAICAGMSNV